MPLVDNCDDTAEIIADVERCHKPAAAELHRLRSLGVTFSHMHTVYANPDGAGFERFEGRVVPLSTRADGFFVQGETAEGDNVELLIRVYWPARRGGAVAVAVERTI